MIVGLVTVRPKVAFILSKDQKVYPMSLKVVVLIVYMTAYAFE